MKVMLNYAFAKIKKCVHVKSARNLITKEEKYDNKYFLYCNNF